MKKKKDPDKYEEFYKTVKVPIKYVLKNLNINLPKINNTVNIANKIFIHTLQFIKLYSIDYYNKNNKLPNIDKNFINSVMKILCVEKSTGRPPNKDTKDMKEKLKIFYEEHYKKLLANNEILEYTHMNTILDYLTIDIITMYENNIKQRYVTCVETVVNAIWQKNMLIDKIKKIKKTKKQIDDSIHKLNNVLRKIKIDLLELDDNFKSHKSYHKWIIIQRNLIRPIKEKFEKDSVYYDIHCNPQEYYSGMFYMMNEIEKRNFSIQNIFPLRSEIISKHIRLDTTTLVHLLMTDKQGKKSDYLFEGNLKRNEDKIWNFFFRTERKCFNKLYYSFHHMIETDGLSCSILFLRNDLVGKKVRQFKFNSCEKYIDELESSDYERLEKKKIIAIDPGKSDLLYCVDNYDKDSNNFRYTQDQRRKETKSKKYSKIILLQKKTVIDNKTIIDYETELSLFNRKTLDFEKFREYIFNKNKINAILFEFYNKELFRKLKLNGYTNRLRTEQKLINNFKKKFGSEKEIVICIGDFEQKRHMKYKEPVKGKGFRTLFRKNGFETYLVDEYKTSCECSGCEKGRCERFIVKENPRPFRNNLILCWGLLKCKTCDGIWNRDCNGAKNIYKVSENYINGLDIPLNLQRKKNKSDVLQDIS